MQPEAANRRFGEACRLLVYRRRSRIERWAVIFHLRDDAGPITSYLNLDGAALVVFNTAMFNSVGDSLDQDQFQAKCAPAGKLVSEREFLQPAA